jgi:hypothetical protein
MTIKNVLQERKQTTRTFEMQCCRDKFSLRLSRKSLPHITNSQKLKRLRSEYRCVKVQQNVGVGGGNVMAYILLRFSLVAFRLLNTFPAGQLLCHGNTNVSHTSWSASRWLLLMTLLC